MSIVDKSTTLPEAFHLADSILNQAAKGISDLINVHGMINLDFADVETIMKNMGEAIMGTGLASGEERAALAAQQAIASPLLDNASISGAQGVLVNITGGKGLTLHEVDEATSIIFEEAGDDANIIFGAVIDPNLDDEIQVTVIATGFNNHKLRDNIEEMQPERISISQRETSQKLGEKINLSLSEQRNPEEEIAQNEEKPQSNLFIDDDNPVIYGNDMEIPAFIRRQHE